MRERHSALQRAAQARSREREHLVGKVYSSHVRGRDRARCADRQITGPAGDIQGVHALAADVAHDPMNQLILPARIQSIGEGASEAVVARRDEVEDGGD